MTERFRFRILRHFIQDEQVFLCPRMLLTLGQALQFVRIIKNWTQMMLAGELGISQNCISSWECGRTTPRIKEWERVAGLLKSLDFSVHIWEKE